MLATGSSRLGAQAPVRQLAGELDLLACLLSAIDHGRRDLRSRAPNQQHTACNRETAFTRLQKLFEPLP